jgi:hypothetical protein
MDVLREDDLPSLAERRALLRRRRGRAFWQRLLIVVAAATSLAWLVIFAVGIFQPH